MAQAECITTAIRELVSRGRPPNSTSSVRAAHTEFVAVPAGNVPENLKGRAEHLEKVSAALRVCLTAIIAETAQDIPASTLNRCYLEGLFQQFLADALGTIRDAAAEMRGRENRRVP